MLRVARWVDCSDRYGLGYALSDGTLGAWRHAPCCSAHACADVALRRASVLPILTGAVYVDGSRMSSRADGTLEYAERRRRRRTSGKGRSSGSSGGSSGASLGSPVQLRPEDEADWPPELRKKAAILRYMAGKLDGGEGGAGAHSASPARFSAAPAALASPGSPGSPAAAAAAAPHVRAWARSRHALVFRLSSCAVQLRFTGDTSQLLLTADGANVWFDSGDGHIARYDLAALPPAEGAGAPLLARLRYARALLARLSSGSPLSAADADAEGELLLTCPCV
jgi:hypothetical protein